MFKAGDEVRVVRHRNYRGDHIGVLDGKVVVIDEVADQIEQIHEFTVFETKCGWLVRSDDIELVNDSPVRTVTRREIVPGTYGRVVVGKTYEAGIWFEIADDEKGALILTAEELDNVAMIASQLAEALRDG